MERRFRTWQGQTHLRLAQLQQNLACPAHLVLEHVEGEGVRQDVNLGLESPSKSGCKDPARQGASKRRQCWGSRPVGHDKATSPCGYRSFGALLGEVFSQVDVCVIK